MVTNIYNRNQMFSNRIGACDFPNFAMSETTNNDSMILHNIKF